MGFDVTDRDPADLDSLRRLARYSVALALVIAVLSSLAFFAAFGWDIEAALLGHTSALLDAGPSAGALLRWGAFGDMFYSYLLLVPLALFLHRRLRPIRPWLADLGTVGAFAYIFVGASGAAILAIAGSSLVDAYPSAGPDERAAIATSLDALRNVVYGLWQTLDPITAGTWMVSVGWLLLPERRLVGRFLVVLGGGAMGLTLMNVLQVQSLATLLLLLAIVLAVWIGWVVIDPRRE